MEGVGVMSNRVRVLRHRLPPFLCEAFGGTTSLLAVRVVCLPLVQSFPPNRYARKTESVLGAAAPNAASCDDHGEGHPEAEIEDLLGFGAELLVRRTYVFKHATCCRSTFERADLRPPKDDISGVEGL